MIQPSDRRRAWAWLAVTAALAVHVTDETLTDFLPLYNSFVRSARQRLSFFPFPTFTFEVWLSGLVLLVCLLIVLSIPVFDGKRWTMPLCYLLGTIMLFNGLGHVAGSFYLGRLMPGVYSSPLLLASSIWLLVATFRRTHKP